MRRIYVFFIFMGIFSAAYQLGSMSTVDLEEAEKFIGEFEELIKDITAIEIFTHNASLALPMFIPGFGVAWGLFSAWSTGYAFAAIVLLNPLLSGIPALSILFLSPFGLMELTAYSLGTSRSYILFSLIMRKKPISPQLKMTVIEIGIMVGLLLAGGFIEFYMIEMIEENETPEWLFGLE